MDLAVYCPIWKYADNAFHLKVVNLYVEITSAVSSEIKILGNSVQDSATNSVAIVFCATYLGIKQTIKVLNLHTLTCEVF